MSVNKKSSDTIKRVSTYVLAVICGAAACGMMIALFSAVMYVLQLPPETAGVMSLLSFAAGCMLCGFICGSIKKRGGLRLGLICGAVMTFIVLVVSCIMGLLTGNEAAAKALTAISSACVGAVLGVNRRGA